MHVENKTTYFLMMISKIGKRDTIEFENSLIKKQHKSRYSVL